MYIYYMLYIKWLWLDFVWGNQRGSSVARRPRNSKLGRSPTCFAVPRGCLFRKVLFDFVLRSNLNPHKTFSKYFILNLLYLGLIPRWHKWAERRKQLTSESTKVKSRTKTMGREVSELCSKAPMLSDELAVKWWRWTTTWLARCSEKASIWRPSCGSTDRRGKKKVDFNQQMVKDKILWRS